MKRLNVDLDMKLKKFMQIINYKEILRTMGGVSKRHGQAVAYLNIFGISIINVMKKNLILRQFRLVSLPKTF